MPHCHLADSDFSEMIHRAEKRTFKCVMISLQDHLLTWTLLSYLKETLEYGGESIMKVFFFSILILHMVCPAVGVICRMNGCSCEKMEQRGLKQF